MATATSAERAADRLRRLISLVSAAAARLRQLLLRQLPQVCAPLALFFALFAQLFLKDLQALVQEHSALLALEIVVHALGYLVLERDELVLLDQGLKQQEQAGLRGSSPSSSSCLRSGPIMRLEATTFTISSGSVTASRAVSASSGSCGVWPT